MKSSFPILAAAAVISAIAMLAWPGGVSEHLAPGSAVAAGETCSPARPRASGTTVESITTGDGARSYRLHVPASYTGASPVPVVIASHGAGSNAFEQEVYSGFSTKSDAEGFIVAYPQGLAPGGRTFFNAWQLASIDDVGYINAMLNSIESQLCTDRSRVYATGISNGGMLSVRLACSMSSRIAAIAPVAGSYSPPMALNLNAAETCPDTRAVPVIAFHGTADETVPYPGGVPAGSTLNYRLPQDNATPDEDVLADWALHNGCTGARQETQIDTEVALIQYGSCVAGATVQLYRVDPGGHTWPGSFDVPSLGYTTQQIDATDLIWSFFTGFTVPDADADLVPDTFDNCPVAGNFAQTNSDRNFIDHPLPITQDDKTVANSDLVGDACDADDDNDGISDADEASGATCAGTVTDPLIPDTDADRFLDYAECVMGFDPTSQDSKPTIAQCAAHIGVTTSTDTDGDKFRDYLEFCHYNSSPASVDTDGDKGLDGAIDRCEITSLNGDRLVNIADRGLVAQAVSDPARRHVNIDINKDGVFNVGDVGLVAISFGSQAVCTT